MPALNGFGLELLNYSQIGSLCCLVKSEQFEHLLGEEPVVIFVNFLGFAEMKKMAGWLKTDY